MDQFSQQQSDGTEIPGLLSYWLHFFRATGGMGCNIVVLGGMQLCSVSICKKSILFLQLQPIEKDFMVLREKMEAKVSVRCLSCTGISVSCLSSRPH